MCIARKWIVFYATSRNRPAPGRIHGTVWQLLPDIAWSPREHGEQRRSTATACNVTCNRRQPGACVGLVPQPYDSGQSHVDQGISKQGNRRVRTQLVETAWCWLRYQPDSALARWFNERTQGPAPSRRARRIAIVALARRLVIALWRYLKDGVVPDGARFKPA